MSVELENCPSAEELRAKKAEVDAAAMDKSVKSFTYLINRDIVKNGQTSTEFLEWDIANFDRFRLIRLAEEKGYTCVYREDIGNPLRHTITVSIPSSSIPSDETPAELEEEPQSPQLLVDDTPLTPEQIDAITDSLRDEDTVIVLDSVAEKPKDTHYSLLSLVEIDNSDDYEYDFLEIDDEVIIAHDKPEEKKIEKTESKDIEISNGLFDRIANGIVNYFSKKS